MTRPIAYYDTEVFSNFVLAAAMTEDGTKHAWFGVYEDYPVQQLNSLREFLKSHTLITFNGKGYDIPILMLILRGEPVSKIKEASNRIVMDNLKPWNFEDIYNVKLERSEIDHIDLMEVAPLTGGLKLYAGKCHSLSVQDLPYDPMVGLSHEQQVVVTEYCYNDLLSTRDLHQRLKVQIHLREQMGKQYGLDLRSKSDAQMAESIIKAEVEKLAGKRVFKPTNLTGTTFTYRIPEWMQFREIDILEDVRKAEFMVSDKGTTVLPATLKDRVVPYRGKEYRMGVGGLHSNESQQVLHADQDHMIIDFDVASYYPAIVLNLGLYPTHLGKEFLYVYRTLRDRRLEAKNRATELKKEIAELKKQITEIEYAEKESHIS